MTRFTEESLAALRSAIDMIDLVSTKAELRRAGPEYAGLCPFHKERTPSFSVNPEHKVFFCFGCAARGDAFHFVERTQGLGFTEAAEWLARRYRVQLETVDDEQGERRRVRKGHTMALLSRTADYFAKFLWDAQEATLAREYLEGRGLKKPVLVQFRAGYASVAWDRVLKGARRDGVNASILQLSGLIQTSGGVLHDRFRERIMFPITDAQHRVLGFAGRALTEDQKPKYLNSPESELFHKSRLLFGIDQARPHAARLGRVIVVEGYTDVLALHQAGIMGSVAIMGTSLTALQMAELTRIAPLVVLALDADRAGHDAMLRAANMARGRGTELRAIDIPSGEDPAALLVAEGSARFTERLDGALQMAEFQLRRLLADADVSSKGSRDKVLDEARALILLAPDMKQELTQLVAEQLLISPTYI